jgi:hypothetical protein
LNFSVASPFGVFGATTWLNLMMIGDCAAAGLTRVGPARANATTDAAASINLRMFPPAYFFRSARSEACMPAAPIQRSRTDCHCPLAGAASQAVLHCKMGRSDLVVLACFGRNDSELQ